jgi:mono/diheme cytochrome c family protein
MSTTRRGRVCAAVYPRAVVAVVLMLAPGAGACRGGDEPAPPPAAGGAPAVNAPAPPAAVPAAAPVSAAAVTEAEDIFKTRCTPCHGPQGRGDGPASAGLTPPPRNFSSPEWQKGVTDEHIEKIVVYGGIAVGRSPAMPGNPDLDGKPEVVRALRGHIRKLGQ